MKRVTALFLISLTAVSWAVADRPMERAQTLQLFERLCRRPTAGWIQTGRLKAIHHSSDIITGETTETLETVTTDGKKFAWQIRMTPDSDAAASKTPYSKDFMEWNRDRVFIWDGLLYTLYFRPGNHAIVYENPSIPVVVTGPLTAGHIPWGQGIFTLKSLSAASFSATEVQTKDGLRIQLSLQPADRPQMQFVLDPARADAVLSYTLLRAEGSRVIQTYGNFIEQENGWIPTNILIDRYDHNQLQTSDAWEIVSVQNMLPRPESFTVAFQEKALVEYHSPVLDKAVFYRHSDVRNIKPLLEKRFVAALKKEDLQKQNCGTVAVEKILSEVGISVTDLELEALIRADSGDTTLYQIQQFLLQKGLSCLPVKTDIPGLGRFKKAQVLLHFPQKKHFVLLDRIDGDTVWLIDLDRQTFYHSMDFVRLKQEWAGIALVISKEPFSVQGDERPIPDPILENIAGSADYSCSNLIQHYDVVFCPQMALGSCGGRYEMWNDLYGCKIDASGGYCEGTKRVSSVYSSCIEDMHDPIQCTPTGNFIAKHMRACQP